MTKSDKRALEELSDGLEPTKDQKARLKKQNGRRATTNLGDILRKNNIKTTDDNTEK